MGIRVLRFGVACSSLVLGCLGVRVAAAQCPPRWTQLASTGPSPRLGFGMTYDEARSRIVIFGGYAQTQDLMDTWAWDGTSWSNISNEGPPARGGLQIAYDSARDRIVLYGGSAPGITLQDTWEWDGQHWAQVMVQGPGPRGATRWLTTRREASWFSSAAPTIRIHGLGTGCNGRSLQRSDLCPGAMQR